MILLLKFKPAIINGIKVGYFNQVLHISDLTQFQGFF